MVRAIIIATLAIFFSICCPAQTIDIQKIEVKGTRTRYNRHNNPAIELAEKLIENKDSQNPFRHAPFVGYQRYERILIAIDNFKRIDSTKKLSFLNDQTVVNPASGKTILPILLKERVVQTSRRGDKSYNKQETELLSRSTGLDERFSQESIMAYLATALPEVDIFAEQIPIVQRHFVGPLARSATGFYKYYLSPDTITIDSSRYVTLSFYPRAKQALGLRGSLTVSVDEPHFVRSAEILIPGTSDVNWVRNLSLRQTFSRDSSGMRLLDNDVINMEFKIINAFDVLAVKRENKYSFYTFERPSDTIKPVEIRTIVDENEVKMDRQLSRLAPSMRRNTFFKIVEELALLVTEGYVGTDRHKSYVDIGPIASFLTGNPLEGTRLSLGGVTTTNLSKHLFLEGRASYGTRDKVWKYLGAVEWSFTPKKRSLREFPINSLRFSASYDTHRFSDGFGDQSAENVFSWAKRMPDSSLTYVQRYELNYTRELKNHLSFSLTARHYTEKESAVMSFYPDRWVLPSYTMSEAELRVRYSPREVIYQSKFRRHNLQKYYTTVEMSHISGFPNLLGSDYRRNTTELSFSGCVGLQPIGYFDLDARVGAEWNQVPYMLLPHPRTDPSYIIPYNNAFAFMTPLEFLYDRYAFWAITYHMDGLLFNRIPFIKYLKLREVFTFKGVWGTLTEKNNPTLNPSLIPFPDGSAAMGRKPYMEIGVGIENIFSVFRIDYVWRLNYLGKPGVIHSGIMFNFSLKF